VRFAVEEFCETDCLQSSGNQSPPDACCWSWQTEFNRSRALKWSLSVSYQLR